MPWHVYVARCGDGTLYTGITTDRARAYGLIGAAFGLGFILGPALSGILAGISYTAPIWAAAAITLVATAMAWLWLPETVHRTQASTGNPFRYLPALLRRQPVRRILTIDFIYWFAFAIFQTTFSLFAARRFGFDLARTGYFFAGFGLLGAVDPGRAHPAGRPPAGRQANVPARPEFRGGRTRRRRRSPIR